MESNDLESPTIFDLIVNCTLNSRMAAILAVGADMGLSLLFVAVPRFAGKTTLMNCILSLLRPEILIHRATGDQGEMYQLQTAKEGGFLVVEELSEAPIPRYLWGPEINLMFETLSSGYSLATALHADSIEAAFEVLCKENGVTDEQASQVDLVLYIRRFDDGDGKFWRRLSEIHEVDYVRDGAPVSRVIYRWVEESDDFEQVAEPSFLRGDLSTVNRIQMLLDQFILECKTGTEDVGRLIGNY